MTVRITPTDTSDDRVLKIDGWLHAPDLPELERLCAKGEQALTLDLSELRSVDDAAVSFLRQQRAQGARLIGVSAYLTLRLDGTGR
ncbi:hypothetical protein [Thiocystis violacea]|uniref:hypothetical protein n=1 Tax=Thiocystis violacea TaxID=13725 RepID=UPI001A90D728|nr:hypothetical protein [Thiocystis violacea]